MQRIDSVKSMVLNTVASILCAPNIDFEKSVGTIFDDKAHFKEVVVA